MSPVCTYCGEPILTTDKTDKGPQGIVHYRCRKRATQIADYDQCPQCKAFAVSALLNCCLVCPWKGM